MEKITVICSQLELFYFVILESSSWCLLGTLVIISTMAGIPLLRRNRLWVIQLNLEITTHRPFFLKWQNSDTQKI